MSDAKTILNMIETVDPNDTAKMDEIDARVWCFVSFWNKFSSIDKGRLLYIDTCGPHMRGSFKIKYIPQYTRSRDALKAIRPEGWAVEYLNQCQRQDGLPKPECFYDWWECRLFKKPENYGTEMLVRRGIKIVTEELAELHAIIQAIEYERTQK